MQKENHAQGTAIAEGRPPIAGRLFSLDVFRGVTIAAMILVNDGGDWKSTYWPLKHAKWNGWTPTDLIFPFFLFIVGVSMVFSFSSRLERGRSRGEIMKHVLRRGAILFALGIFVNGFPTHFDPRTLRIEGVLQRIALCYVISAVLFLWLGTRGRIAAIFGCLVGYWILMRYFPVPGFGVPTHDIRLLDINRNLAAWLDRKLLYRHLFNGSNDPEGVLSTIPAVASTLAGVLTAEWLRSTRSLGRKAIGMTVCGVLSFVAGEVINLWFPINKNLWTSSFVLLTTGLGMIFLALCYWLFDIVKAGRRFTTPIFVFGLNPIAAYVFSEALASGLDAIRLNSATYGNISLHEWIYHALFVQVASPANASLLYALAYVLVCWATMWILYRKGIFLKV